MDFVRTSEGNNVFISIDSRVVEHSRVKEKIAAEHILGISVKTSCKERGIGVVRDTALTAAVESRYTEALRNVLKERGPFTAEARKTVEFEDCVRAYPKCFSAVLWLKSVHLYDDGS